MAHIFKGYVFSAIVFVVTITRQKMYKINVH